MQKSKIFKFALVFAQQLHKYFKEKKNESGIAVLLVVIIIGAAGLLMARGTAFLGLGEMDMSYTASQGNNAYYLAEACLEEALLRYKFDNNFSAVNLNLSLNQGSCVINTSDLGANKKITVTGAINDYHKIIEATASINSGDVFLESLSVSEI